MALLLELDLALVPIVDVVVEEINADWEDLQLLLADGTVTLDLGDEADGLGRSVRELTQRLQEAFGISQVLLQVTPRVSARRLLREYGMDDFGHLEQRMILDAGRLHVLQVSNDTQGELIDDGLRILAPLLDGRRGLAQVNLLIPRVHVLLRLVLFSERADVARSVTQISSQETRRSPSLTFVIIHAAFQVGGLLASGARSESHALIELAETRVDL